MRYLLLTELEQTRKLARRGVIIHLYGGLFDLIAASFERVFHTADVWELRHLLSGLFGLVGMAERAILGQPDGTARVVEAASA